MKKFKRTIGAEVEAEQWFPGCETIGVADTTLYPDPRPGSVGYKVGFGPYGVLNCNETVFPGDWIIKLENGQLIRMSDEQFRRMFIEIKKQNEFLDEEKMDECRRYHAQKHPRIQVEAIQKEGDEARKESFSCPDSSKAGGS